MIGPSIAILLKRYRARHKPGCPELQQSHWRVRGEYRPANYGPDKPCTCGLDELVGEKGWAKP